MQNSRSQTQYQLGVPYWVSGLTYALVFLLVGLVETTRWADQEYRHNALAGWICGRDANWLPFLPLLMSAVIVSSLRGRGAKKKQPSKLRVWLDSGAEANTGFVPALAVSVLLGVVALAVSRHFDAPFSTLPPAYHDEFSYLFQAQTYLDGRLSYPSYASNPELFNQMHVLNEGHFASRYFPGVGAWIAPFLALGDPILGYQFAQGLCTFFMFWIGRELSSNRVGVIASLLFALSPGMILFSTLLLSHHPTLVGLLAFLWLFLRWMRTGSLASLTIAGVGLSYAMLCRPMTAAAFAFPFGVYFVWFVVTGRSAAMLLASQANSSMTDTQVMDRITDRHFGRKRGTNTPVVPMKSRMLAFAAMAVPLAIGIGVFASINFKVTGEYTLSPYQQYTDIYTPRHRYGFNNVVNAESHLGPKVIDNYDRWAVNLTPAIALQNFCSRFVASLQWTLGIVPLMLGILPVLLTSYLGTNRWWLIVASVVSMHLAHIPYWFVGIMNWHYVLETAPLLLLLFAEGNSRLLKTWKVELAWGVRIWWRALIITAVSVNLFTVRPLWPGRLPVGLEETAFSRRIFGEFRHQIEQARGSDPAIVFVIPDPSDVHMDYVANPPSLQGPVLVGKVPSRENALQRAKEFPERTVLLFDAAHKQWDRLRGPLSNETR